METLSSFTKEMQLKIEREYAWTVLNRNFDQTKPRRFASGVCVSSARKNSNGDAFKAAGLNVTIPIPLLWNHGWLQPIGKVFAIDVFGGDEVHWKAEIINSACLSWAEDAWMEIMCKFTTGVSVGARNLASYDVFDGTYCDWGIDEISIAEKGADPGARVCRVWERAPVIYLDGRPSTTVFWSTP
jgi:hypothetical protein